MDHCKIRPFCHRCLHNRTFVNSAPILSSLHNWLPSSNPASFSSTKYHPSSSSHFLPFHQYPVAVLLVLPSLKCPPQGLHIPLFKSACQSHIIWSGGSIGADTFTHPPQKASAPKSYLVASVLVSPSMFGARARGWVVGQSKPEIEWVNDKATR